MFWKIGILIVVLVIITFLFNTKVESYSLDQKIGQFFIVGFDGTIFNKEIESLIKEFHPGGVLLLKKNIESEKQLKTLISSLQKTSDIPLFISIDQEGEYLSRINWYKEERVIDSAFEISKKRGEYLKSLGINLNFSPVLDEAFPGDFIFERSQNRDFGKEIVEGQDQGGIISCVKHFPGYGNISFNPEEKLAKVDQLPDISIFKDINAKMIMTANVIFNENLPFSFIKQEIDFLKKEVKGDYLIISDDLDQNSLLKSFSLQDIVSLPFLAGNDLLIFSGWRLPSEQGILAFKKAVVEGKISLGEVDKGFLKIIEFKKNEKIF